jgi:hypothetical protein
LAGLILNVPYGCPYLPKAVHKRLRHTPEELNWENWRLTDPFLLDLVKKSVGPEFMAPPLSQDLVKSDPNSPHRLPDCRVVSYPFSPLVADPIGLVARDLGLIKTPKPFILNKGTLEKELPTWTASDKEFIFSHCVEPYLAELKQVTSELLAKESLALLLTIRFFTFKDWKLVHRETPKPEINLALEDELTPKGLAILAGHVFRRFGLWTELDFPLLGGGAPLELASRPRLKALGLAIRRDLYLDEKQGVLKSSSASLVRVLRIFFVLLGQELDRVAEVRLRRAFPPKRPSSVIKASEISSSGLKSL